MELRRGRALFRLVSEAHRIRLAHLFDPVPVLVALGDADPLARGVGVGGGRFGLLRGCGEKALSAETDHGVTIEIRDGQPGTPAKSWAPGSVCLVDGAARYQPASASARRSLPPLAAPATLTAPVSMIRLR